MAKQDDQPETPPELPPKMVEWLRGVIGNWSKEKSGTAEERLTPELRKAVLYELVNDYTIRRGYANVVETAKHKGTAITGDAIQRAEEPYASLMKDFDKQLDSLLKEATEKRYKEKEAAGTRFTDKLKDVPILGVIASKGLAGGLINSADRLIIRNQYISDYVDVYLNHREKAREPVPSMEYGALTAAFNRNFEKHFLADAPRKNLEISPDVKTVPELLTALLAQNPGIAVGDIHVEQEPPQLVADHMALFKKAGVDTVYVERDKAFVAKYAALSTEELQTLLETRKLKDKDITLSTAQEVASAYAKKYADDVDVQWTRLEIAAREQGIRIVGMDSVEAAAGADIVLRIPVTNPVWTDNIRRDREQLAAQGKGGGKFVVIGGLGHFTNDDDSRGHVDEALGIPVLSFDRTTHTLPAFREGNRSNGADFYLAAGPSYYPARKLANLQDERDWAQFLKRISDKTDNEWLKDFAGTKASDWRWSIMEREMKLQEQYEEQRPQQPGKSITDVEVPKTPVANQSPEAETPRR